VYRASLHRTETRLVLELARKPATTISRHQRVLERVLACELSRAKVLAQQVTLRLRVRCISNPPDTQRNLYRRKVFACEEAATTKRVNIIVITMIVKGTAFLV
jgi:hypothetical protein